jgi:predicted Zn-dependent peptidase
MNNNIITLPNNIRIAVDEMKDIETISIAVFVKTGSRNENLQNNGVSHFLEHMAFKGTKTRTAKEIAEQFEDIGGRINAYTSRETTVYYVKILKKDVQFAVEFLSDILQNSTFDKIELEKERGVILQEIAMTNDTPDDIIFDYFQETAFPDQPLGRSILGPEKNVQNFKQSDLKNYIDQQYNYSNIAICAAGNISEEKFTGYVQKYFNKLGDKNLKKIEEGKYQGGTFSKQKDLEQLHTLIGFNSVSYLNENYYRCQILASILGGGMSSRLFQSVREELGLAYSIYAFNYSNADSGLFGIYCGTDPQKADKMLDSVKVEIEKITQNITQKELSRTINQVQAGLLMSLESSHSRCQKLGNDILTKNRIVDHKEIIEKISNISVNDLQNFAKNVFDSKTTFTALGKNPPQSFKI